MRVFVLAEAAMRLPNRSMAACATLTSSASDMVCSSLRVLRGPPATAVALGPLAALKYGSGAICVREGTGMRLCVLADLWCFAHNKPAPAWQWPPPWRVH